jgi:hypothetical protein
MLKQGQRSLAVRMWNEGATLEEIAEKLDTTAIIVGKFLQTRPCYPERIPNSRRTTPAPAVRAPVERKLHPAKAEPEKNPEPPRNKISLASMPWQN